MPRQRPRVLLFPAWGMRRGIHRAMCLLSSLHIDELVWVCRRVRCAVQMSRLPPHPNVIAYVPGRAPSRVSLPTKDGHSDLRPCQAFELCDHDLLDLLQPSASASVSSSGAANGGVSSTPVATLPEPLASRVFAQVAAGLAHCHAAGVYHMDVKADNILVKGSVAKLADFGNAVIAPSPSTSPRHATDDTVTPLSARTDQRPWGACGTVAYACPEAIANMQSGSPVAPDAGALCGKTQCCVCDGGGCC